jgi:hypothetical protein
MLSVLVLSACASAPDRGLAVLTVANDAADELECVGKCLEFGDESCESCVDRCMEPIAPSAAVAAMGRGPVTP